MNLAMYDITVGEHSDYKIPFLQYRGTPTAIDVFRVARTGITPVLDVGLAGRDGGQIGAGIVRAPIECFTNAVATYESIYGPAAGSERTRRPDATPCGQRRRAQLPGRGSRPSAGLAARVVDERPLLRTPDRGPSPAPTGSSSRTIAATVSPRRCSAATPSSSTPPTCTPSRWRSASSGPWCVGWSMGAMVAYEYLQLAGDGEVAGLVVVDQGASDFIWPDYPEGVFTAEDLAAANRSSRPTRPAWRESSSTSCCTSRTRRRVRGWSRRCSSARRRSPGRSCSTRRSVTTGRRSPR